MLVIIFRNVIPLVQVKRNMITSIANFIYQLHHGLLKDIILRTLVNQKIFGKFQNSLNI